MEQRSRDKILGMLSAAGLLWLASLFSSWTGVFVIQPILEFAGIWPLPLSDVINIVFALKMLLFLIGGILVWKKIKVSNDFTLYFLALFVAIFVINLIYKIVLVLS